MTRIHHLFCHDDLNTHAHAHVHMVPSFTTNLCQLVGRALVEFTEANNVIIGRRQTNILPSVVHTLCKGISQQGANVIDIGHCSDEQLGFAVHHYGADAAIMIGDIDENDLLAFQHFSFFNYQAEPINYTNGLLTIWSLAQYHAFDGARVHGSYQQHNITDEYLMNLVTSFQYLVSRPSDPRSKLTLVVQTNHITIDQLLRRCQQVFAQQSMAVDLILLAKQQQLFEQSAAYQADAVIQMYYDQQGYLRGDIYDHQGIYLDHQSLTKQLVQLYISKYDNSLTTYYHRSMQQWQITSLNQAIHNTIHNAIYTAIDSRINSRTNSRTASVSNQLALVDDTQPILPWLLLIMAQLEARYAVTQIANQQYHVTQVANQQHYVTQPTQTLLCA